MTLDPQAKRILEVLGKNPAPKLLDLPFQQIRAAAADANRCAPLCALCFIAVLDRMYDPLISFRHADPR